MNEKTVRAEHKQKWKQLPKETPQDVINLLSELEDEYGWEVGYTFGHIVIADWNMSDDNIRFCLAQERIDSWFSDKLSECEEGTADSKSLYLWERFCYDDLVEYRDNIIDFLNMLLTISEDVRDTASAILWGDAE